MSEHRTLTRVNKNIFQSVVLVIAMAITPSVVFANVSPIEKILEIFQILLNGNTAEKQRPYEYSNRHSYRNLYEPFELYGPPHPYAQLYPYNRLDLHELIKTSARRHGINDYQLASIVIIESAGDPCAVSHKNAKGLGQLIDPTAASLGVRDSFDPRQNLDGAAKYYAMQLVAAKGNAELAAAAYNFGPRAMRTPYAAWPRETKQYVYKFHNLNKQFRRADWRHHLPQSIPAANRKTCLG